ncbi:PAS domain S-box protein [Bacillus sp. FJAT-27231]|uniref:PAS domain S-box protein n=1 Tax=Bacillus sp. FJAT-27231 TaxID=1679168 RepID=UPI0006713D58|nr:PAS domain S-box protein [Bacillus sp. FJAT-27231]
MKNYTERSNSSLFTEVMPASSEEEKPQGEEEGHSKVNILMVDDHPENLLVLKAVLASPDYHLVCANSGEEALKHVLKQEFAVILLDVQMPGLNGFETANLIKEREKSKYIPIIFITAINQTMENVIKGYGVGAVDYIFKPFHPETLKLKVQQFVKIYQNHKKVREQSEVRRQNELKEVNEKLERTTHNLRKNEELARVIGETLLDTIITFDEQGCILSVNPAVTRMFGYTTGELLGKHMVNLLPGFSPSLMDYVREMTGQLLEASVKNKEGREVPVEIQIGEAQVEEEYLFVCSIRDITDRKKMEKERKRQYDILEKLVEERTRELSLANEQLRREVEEREKMAEALRLSKEHFYKIFQSSPSLIELRTLEDGKYIDVNESWLQHTGYTHEEVLNQTAPILNIAGVGHLKKGECVQNAEIQYQTKSGAIRHGLLSTEILEIQGETCVLSAVTDITERVRLESEVARLDRLYLVGEMAAGIAHEIRNPMTTVRGFLELSKSDPGSLMVKYVDLMLGELDRANSIITEFLNLAKNKVSNKKRQYLNPVIEGLYPLIQAEALMNDKFVSLQLGECPEFHLDEKEISQLILNLSLNGLEAMKPGGKLVLKTYTEEDQVVLEVKDEGDGIKPELLEMIGTPFFTTKDTGTGLGLAICYSVAERHHAIIDLKTSEQGTTFFIRFTLTEEN